MEDRVKHKSKKSQPVKAGEVGGQPFIIAGQTTKAGGPGKGALHHSGSGEQDETFSRLFQFDDEETDSRAGGLSLGLFSGHFLHPLAPTPPPGRAPAHWPG